MLSQYEREELVNNLVVASLVKPDSPLERPAKECIRQILRGAKRNNGSEGKPKIQNKKLGNVNSVPVAEKKKLKGFAFQVVKEDPDYVRVESKVRLWG